jgi:lipopolysaccharide transport system permease protein
MAAIYTTRHFIISSAKREVHSRYANTLLGPAWVLLQPLMMITIYTLIFSKVMQNRLPESNDAFGYSIHLCAALLPWMFFTELLSRLQGMYVDNANLIKKLAIPRPALALVSIATCSFNFLIFMGLFFIFLILMGKFPTASILFIFIPLSLQLALTVTAGLFFAIANAYFRDTGHLIGIILQLGFWFTPIVYPFSILPEWTHTIVQINPFVGLSRYYQNIFLLNQPGDLFWLLPALLWTLLFLALSALTYKAHGKEVVDVL